MGPRYLQTKKCLVISNDFDVNMIFSWNLISLIEENLFSKLNKIIQFRKMESDK